MLHVLSPEYKANAQAQGLLRPWYMKCKFELQILCIYVGMNSAQTVLMESYVLSFQTFLCSYACSYGPDDRRGQDEVK